VTAMAEHLAVLILITALSTQPLLSVL